MYHHMNILACTANCMFIQYCVSPDPGHIGTQDCIIWLNVQLWGVGKGSPFVGIGPSSVSDWMFLFVGPLCVSLYMGVAVTKLGFGICFSTWSSVWFCQYQKCKESCRCGKNITRLFTKMFLLTNHKPPSPTKVSWIHNYYIIELK